MRRRLVVIAAAFTLLALWVPGGAAADSPGTAAQAERTRILAYWTPGRIATAIPRDFVRDGAGQIVPRAKPGGTTSSAVKGASWTGDGIVEQRSGRILFTMGGVNYICSGSVVADGSTTNGYSTVLTAGHCVWDAVDGWATNWLYIPDFDDAPTYTCADTVHGCWTATRLAAHERFVTAAGFNDQAVEVDFAFARVEGGGKLEASTLELDAETGGYDLKIGGVALSDTFWAFGYPAAGKYKGKDLTYCKGTLVDDPYGANTWGMACNMTGGSSGGPWLADTTNPGTIAGRVASLNSYGYTGLTYMFGPKFTADTATIQADAIDGGATYGTSRVKTLP
jgi:V8-like Glu-specific endopeptidase